MVNNKYLTAPLRFLHLTDCHFTGNKAELLGWHSLCRFLETISLDIKCDFIFITGDVSDKNKESGYEAAAKILPMLANAMGLPLASVFVVPGNHDINRDQAKVLAVRPDNLNVLLAEEQSRMMIEAPFSRYKSTLQASGVRGADLTEKVVTTHRRDVCVLPINTAWLCRRPDTDQGQLSAAVDQWEAVLAKEAPADDRLVIALMHHAPDWLVLREAKQIRRLLTRWVDLVLCGHEHDEDIYTIQMDGFSFLLVKGAAIAQGSIPYLRANLGGVDIDGTVRFDRILHDAARTGGVDEWIFAKTKNILQISRIDESKMRFFPPSGTKTVARQLQDAYREQFSKDRLIGYDTEDQSKDLLFVYRKLSMSRFRSDDSEQSQSVLWYRLNQLLESTSIGQILARIHVFIASTPLEKVVNTNASIGEAEVLTGHRGTDQDRITRACVRSAYEQNLLAAQEQLRKSRSPKPSGMAPEIVFRTLGQFPALFRNAARCLIEDLCDRRFPTPDRLNNYIWLYVIKRMAIPFFRQGLAGASSDDVLPELLDRVDQLLDGTFNEILGESTGCAAVPPDSNFMELISEIARTPDLVGALGVEELESLLTVLGKAERRRLMGLIADRHASANQTNEGSELRHTESQQYTWSLIIGHWDSLTTDLREKILASIESMNPIHELAATIPVLSEPLVARVQFAAMELLAYSVRGQLNGRVMKVSSVWIFHVMELIHNRVLKDLPSGIYKHFPEDVRATLAQWSAPALAYDRLSTQPIDRESILTQARSMVIHSFGRSLSESVSGLTLSLEEVRASDRSVAILGGPGSGKTTLLRHLCLTCADDEMPIFVPLRLWNSEPNLLACIQRSVRDAGLDYDQIESQLSAASKGRVIFLLDGLDEVKDLSRQRSRELENLIGQYSEATFVLTSRFGTANFLPDPKTTPQYSLNHLTTEDVVNYLEAWYGRGTESSAEITARVLSDPVLLEEIRTPFVLRMFCALTDDPRKRIPWRSRTDMYGRIARYLLQDRDELRGIELQFAYQEKAEVLETIAGYAFEHDLNVIEYDQLVDSVADRFDPDRLVALLAEVIRRSHILVRVGPTSFDFTHWTLREFFAAQGWHRQGCWKTWDDEKFQKYFSHESIPRFLVGMNPGERDFIGRLLSRCIEGNPLAALVIAKVMLEVFSACSQDEQFAHVNDLISSSLVSPGSDMAEAGSLLSQMFHSAGDRSQMSKLLGDKLTLLVGTPIKENTVSAARLLGLCSNLKDESIARSICALLAVCDDELRDPMRLCLGKMGPRAAGACVKEAVQELEDFNLLRGCMISSADWTREFLPQLEKWLAEGDSPPERNLERILTRWIELVGVSGPGDEIERLKSSLHGLMRKSFGLELGPQWEEEALDGTLGFLEDRHLAILRKAWFSVMSNANVINLSQGLGGVFRIIADAEKIDVRVGGSAPRTARAIYRPPNEDLVGLLQDAADSISVRIILGLMKRDVGNLVLAARNAAGFMLKRFRDYIPVDLTDLVRQFVDDLWIYAHRDDASSVEFHKVKEGRARNVMTTANLSEARWEAVLAIVAKLPRRPEPADWVFLQHLFGGLMRDLFKAREVLRATSNSAYNIISEDDWEELYETYQATRR